MGQASALTGWGTGGGAQVTGPAGRPGVTAKPTLAFEQEAGSKQPEAGRPRRESAWRVPDRLNVESPQDPARPCPGPRPRESKTGCSRTRDHAHPRQPTVGTTPGPSTLWLDQHGRQLQAVQSPSAKRRRGHSTAWLALQASRAGTRSGTFRHKGHGLRCHLQERPRTPRLQAHVDSWLSGAGSDCWWGRGHRGAKESAENNPTCTQGRCTLHF